MHIQLETAESNTIRSYTTTEIATAQNVYKESVIISTNSVIFPWPIHSIRELNEEAILPVLQLEPEVIIIGHEEMGALLPIELIAYLSKQRIGIECMSIGAASRTFNVLLSEQRRVVLGIVL